MNEDKVPGVERFDDRYLVEQMDEPKLPGHVEPDAGPVPGRRGRLRGGPGASVASARLALHYYCYLRDSRGKITLAGPCLRLARAAGGVRFEAVGDGVNTPPERVAARGAARQQFLPSCSRENYRLSFTRP